ANVEMDYRSFSKLNIGFRGSDAPMRVKVEMLRSSQRPRRRGTAGTSGCTTYESTTIPSVVEEPEDDDLSQPAIPVERRFESIISNQSCEDLT
ncbi:hypothetical protein Dimus_006103, partial [Dionaea muscipula]